MRSHAEIVKQFGATAMFHALIKRGHVLAAHTPKRWADRDRIPAEWWSDLVAIKAATLTELQASARPRKRRSAQPERAA